ncbi:MAG: alpha/beta hydrolase [Anaerolineae bacterium]|nr:alpha/beta hydrolase [Anaerolineae bacterium]
MTTSEYAGTRELYVCESGPQTAPTIVFLHGGGIGGWMWEPVVAHLGDFHCLMPDLPEQGHSAGVMPFTLAGAATAIEEIIRTRTREGRAHVVGLSLGAQATVALLERAAEVVDHAVVSSCLVRPVPGAAFYTPGLIRASYQWFVQPFKRNEWFIRLNMRSAAGVPEQYFSQFREDYDRTTAESFTYVMLENLKFRQPEGLAAADCPVLVVVGEKENAAMKQSAHDLLTALPNARAVRVNAGKNSAENHNWSFQKPELFARMVRA